MGGPPTSGESVGGWDRGRALWVFEGGPDLSTNCNGELLMPRDGAFLLSESRNGLIRLERNRF